MSSLEKKGFMKNLIVCPNCKIETKVEWSTLNSIESREINPDVVLSVCSFCKGVVLWDYNNGVPFRSFHLLNKHLFFIACLNSGLLATVKITDLFVCLCLNLYLL